MPTQTTKRRYLMSDADLKQKADLVVNNVKRDLADFETRNISASRLQQFETAIEAFANTSTDEELRGLMNHHTAIKDDHAMAVQKAIRQLRNMAAIAYNGTGKYNTFGFEKISRLSDSDLHRTMRRITKLATLLLPDLAAQGLSTNQIDNMVLLNQQLDDAIEALADTRTQRDLQTLDRINKGNALYAELSILCSIGQTLYADTNLAKYNDYLVEGV